MATYNGARFIRQQLDSIADQTVSPTELIVTDDASSDDTVAIVRAFAKTAPFPVRIHENTTRLGYRANFMSNLALCTCDVIALCDQDDVWEPVKLERCLKSFEDPEVLLCFHEAWLIDSENNRGKLAEVYKLPVRNPPLSLWPMRNPFGFAILFRRNLLVFSDLWERSVDNLESENRMAHDQWIFFLASVLGITVYIGEPLAGYRQHDNNTYGLVRNDVGFLRRSSETIARWSVEATSFSIAACGRADILESLRNRVDGRSRLLVQSAAKSYRELSWTYSLRSVVYNAASMVERLKAWGHMVAGGAYSRKRRWPLRRADMVWDLANLLTRRRFSAAGLNARSISSGSGRVDRQPDLTP